MEKLQRLKTGFREEMQFAICSISAFEVRFCVCGQRPSKSESAQWIASLNVCLESAIQSAVVAISFYTPQRALPLEPAQCRFFGFLFAHTTTTACFPQLSCLFLPDSSLALRFYIARQAWTLQHTHFTSSNNKRQGRQTGNHEILHFNLGSQRELPHWPADSTLAVSALAFPARLAAC